MNKIGIGIIAILLVWAVFGSPSDFVANKFWSDSAAPWEEVHAYYYPDKNDLTEYREALSVGSVDACRLWVQDTATGLGDASLQRGDYECGVGCKTNDYGLNVCRLTIQ